MFWIYIPPVILVAALTALVIILGKKSGDIKKIRTAQSEIGISDGERGWKIRLKSIGAKILHLLEKLLILIKGLFKKTEQLSSGWAAKLRARRKGGKIENVFSEEFKSGLDEENIFHEIEKTEVASENPIKDGSTVKYVGNEVIVRKKREEPVAIPRVKAEPVPEDKVKEAALIYRIAENPKDIEAYREIGDYYLAIGNIKDAKESFKMVLKLRPRDLKAKSSLREIEMKMRLGS